MPIVGNPFAFESGGGSAADVVSSFAENLPKKLDNVPVDWIKRINPFGSSLETDINKLSDLENSNNSGGTRLIIDPPDGSNAARYDIQADVRAHTGLYITMKFGKSIKFRSKKGENVFGLVYAREAVTDTSSNVRVTFNGLTPTQLGLVDENGDAHQDFINAAGENSIKFGVTTLYHGLPDDEEQIVKVENLDEVGTDRFLMEAIEYGYVSRGNFARDHELKVYAGSCTVRGTNVDYDETDLTFAESVNCGHTAAAVINSSTGAITTLNGIEPCRMQLKPKQVYNFPSVLTSLDVKNNFGALDTNGICMMQLPQGETYFFSYTSKTDATPQAQSLDNVIWESHPDVSYTPLDNFLQGNAGTGTLNFAATFGVSVNLWAEAPIIIDATNNKVDFRLNRKGGQAAILATATIANGAYSADLVKLGDAISRAMQTASALAGDYLFSYDKVNHLWSAGVDDSEIESIDFLVQSGVANQVFAYLGFLAADLTGANLYRATSEVEHLAVRATYPKEFRSAYHSRIKHTYAGVAGNYFNSTMEKDARERLGIPAFKTISSQTPYHNLIYTEKDACGVGVFMLRGAFCSGFSIHIDEMTPLYVGLCDMPTVTDTMHTNPAAKADIVEWYIPFPRGTKEVRIKAETGNASEHTDHVPNQTFVGYREWATKPAIEKLTTKQAILRDYNISPLQTYATTYGPIVAGPVYVPIGSNEQINSVVETGSWLGSTSAQVLNTFYRYANTEDSHLEVNFDITVDGGGFDFLGIYAGTGSSIEVELYISSGVINEGTDLVDATQQYDNAAITFYNRSVAGYRGLKAGNYNIRAKHTDITRTTSITGLVVTDGVPNEENITTMDEITNNGISTSVPEHVVKIPATNDSGNYVPHYLNRTDFKYGCISKARFEIDHQWTSVGSNKLDYNETTTMAATKNMIFGEAILLDSFGEHTKITGAFCKHLCFRQLISPSYSNLRLAYINGRIQRTLVSAISPFKGGVNAGQSTFTNWSAQVVKQMKHTGTMAGSKFTLGGDISPYTFSTGLHYREATSAEFWGGVVVNDELVVLVPHAHPNIVLYNPKTSKVTIGPYVGEGAAKFAGGCLTNGGLVVFAPYALQTVGVYDPVTNDFIIGDTAPVSPAGTAKFVGAVNDPVSGNVIFIPNSVTGGNFVIYDPVTDIATAGAAGPGGSTAFRGGMLESVNGDIICTPYTADNVGIYTPSTDTYTAGPLTGEANLSFHGRGVEVAGIVYFAPFASLNVGRFTIAGATYSSGAAHGKGASAFGDAVLGNDNKIYFSAYVSANMGQYDPLGNSYTDLEVHGEGSSACLSSVVIPSSDKILNIPYNGNHLFEQHGTDGDTSTIKVGREVTLIDNVGAKETVIVDSFNTDRDFTIKGTLQVLSAANVVSVDTSGYHNIGASLGAKGSNSNLWLSGYAYEPLPITRSQYMRKMKAGTKLEMKRIEFKTVPASGDLWYPTFSDGEQAGFHNSIITGSGVGDTLNEDLKNVAAGDYRIQSTKMVADFGDDDEEF